MDIGKKNKDLKPDYNRDKGRIRNFEYNMILFIILVLDVSFFSRCLWSYDLIV